MAAKYFDGIEMVFMFLNLGDVFVIGADQEGTVLILFHTLTSIHMILEIFSLDSFL